MKTFHRTPSIVFASRNHFVFNYCQKESLTLIYDITEKSLYLEIILQNSLSQ